VTGKVDHANLHKPFMNRNSILNILLRNPIKAVIYMSYITTLAVGQMNNENDKTRF
jgi:hypothetical protein